MSRSRAGSSPRSSASAATSPPGVAWCAEPPGASTPSRHPCGAAPTRSERACPATTRIRTASVPSTGPTFPSATTS
eukprot:3748450-Alexandrium_andersonii.AAC.1